MAQHEPHVAELDEAIRTIAALVEPVPMLINAVEAYYGRKDYLDDDFKVAREYHARLIATIPPLLAAREIAMRQIAVLGEELDRKELDLIEQADGKRYAWHAHWLLSAAGKLKAFFALDTERGRREGLKAAIAEFAAAVRAFDEYSALPDAQPGYNGYNARRLLAAMRDWRDGRGTVWSLVDDYNSMVTTFQSYPDGQ
jgi:hypothetical protein